MFGTYEWQASPRISVFYSAIYLDAERFSDPERKFFQRVGTQDHIGLEKEQQSGLLSSEDEDGLANSMHKGQKVDDEQVRHGEGTDIDEMGHNGNFESFSMVNIWLRIMFLGSTLSASNMGESRGSWLCDLCSTVNM